MKNPFQFALPLRAVPCAMLFAALCAGSAPAVQLRFMKVMGGLDNPVGMEVAPGDRERIYVVEQEGRVRIFSGGYLRNKPFLDVSNKTRMKHSEQGLLGFAFHPSFMRNLKFYTHYTDPNGDTVLSEWTAKSYDETLPGSERIILRQKQPFPNHNGGQIAFGPDGCLYMGLGDGGGAGDPQGNGQKLDTLLGKILRIYVDGNPPYTIPGSNPFARVKDSRPEIWAYGLRNPWRFSFDSNTGLLYIADVGQNEVEEINIENARQGGGRNYGWNVREGDKKYASIQAKPSVAYTEPVAIYNHDNGRCSVTGGYVYRGRSIPDLNGHYFYGDFCSGDIWSFKYVPEQKIVPTSWKTQLKSDKGEISISSFGRDWNGELYVLHYTAGEIYKIIQK